MEIIDVFGADEEKIKTFFVESMLLFPFFSSYSQGCNKFLEKLREKNIAKETYQVSLTENGKIKAVLSYQKKGETIEFTNIFIHKGSFKAQKGLKYWIKQVEKIGKKERKYIISFTFLDSNQNITEKLEELGYQMKLVADGFVKFEKKLTYSTGLVLAGGGARGAYQVGAWKALQELNITYDIICGTSVGALNGGLILQGDLAAAEKMWDEIDTGKILSFPTEKEGDPFAPSTLVKDIQSFAKSAISSLGVSTEPLQKLIRELLNEDVMYEKSQQFYLCTTQIPSMKEVIVSLRETPQEEFHKWLLASSSFFPAMEAAAIDGNYYVDGGYRNNIPVDVALKAGATELIIVDVKGPGITKPTKIPEEIPTVTISSPWSLGTVLLFDGARSAWNIQLGYLETKKAFGCYLGYWYTFDEQLEGESVQRCSEDFLTFIEVGPWEKGRELNKKSKFSHDMLQKFRKLFNDRVTLDNIGLVILELVGKVLDIPPVKLYTVESMKEAIQEKIQAGWTETDEEKETMMLSLQEWALKFANKVALPTGKHQVLYLYQQLKGERYQEEGLNSFILHTSPELYFVVMCIIWLEKQMEEENGTRI